MHRVTSVFSIIVEKMKYKSLLIAFGYSISTACLARPTAEDIHGSSESGSQDLGFFSWLVILIFYGPFIFALLKDKSTRKMIYFIAGSMGTMIFILSSLDSGFRVAVSVGFVLFWLLFGEKIVEKIFPEDDSKINSENQGRVQEFGRNREGEYDFQKAAQKKTSKNSLDATFQQPRNDVSNSAQEIINSQRKIYDEGIWAGKSDVTNAQQKPSNQPKKIPSTGWRHDKANGVLWNESTNEVLRTSSGLGYSYAGAYFILHNNSEPRRILRSEVVDSEFKSGGLDNR